MRFLGLSLVTLAASVVALVSGRAVEQEKSSNLAYEPVIHVSSGILQLTPDTEQPQLLLVPNAHSSSLGNPWPHFFEDTLMASHLPHSLITPAIESNHEPHIGVTDNVNFSQLKLPQHRVVHSHGRR